MESRIRELLGELDRLVPVDKAQVILYDDGDPPGQLPFCASKEGFLRFGLTFMLAAFATSAGRGSNGGEKVVLDLDPICRSDSNVEFLCERVTDMPQEGDRRRPHHLPNIIGGPLILLVECCFLVGF